MEGKPYDRNETLPSPASGQTAMLRKLNRFEVLFPEVNIGAGPRIVFSCSAHDGSVA